MDKVDNTIIELLTLDSRRSLADIGGTVGLSPSSVNERIRRLVASGAIRRFTVELDPDVLGLSTQVFVWVALREDCAEADFIHFAKASPVVLECHHVTGSWSYLLKLRVATTAEIEVFLAHLKVRQFLGRSETVIALSSPVTGAYVQKPPA